MRYVAIVGIVGIVVVALISIHYHANAKGSVNLAGGIGAAIEVEPATSLPAKPVEDRVEPVRGSRTRTSGAKAHPSHRKLFGD
jgi:hypothetical protein